MIYQDYMRRKMHNVIKLGTAEGYPLVINNADGKNIKNYTIYGNTEYSENLFNYTEPTTNSVQADENGWFDVTVDNTTGTATKTVWCTTKPNYRLKTNTQYALFVEVAEKSGSVNNVVATQWSSFPSQLLGGSGTTIVANSIGTRTATIQTRASFDDCENMLRGNVSVPAGQSGHIKFRIAVYETQKDEFIPYTKTSVGDLTDNLFNYTEPKNKDQMAADENGWYDVTIDNSNRTEIGYVFMFTKVNNKLKPDTSYTIVTEIAEYSGDINVRPVTDYTNPSQFGGKNFPIYTTSGTFTATRTTKSTFDDSLYMLRTFCDVPAGKTGHAKFRIAVYECLPAEYQEVEYIESTGKEYIETGCLLNETSVVEIEASLKKSVPKAYGALFGSRISGSTVSGQQNALWWHNWDDENTAKLAALIGESSYRTTDDTVQFGMFRKIRFGCDSLSIDGIKKFTFSKALYANGMNAVLFGLRSGANYVDAKRFNGKIKYCRITTDDVLVRNFIPCYRKSDNVVGMYDTVNGVFYTNASTTGSFLKGADKTYSFEPYNKYKIPIVVSGENNTTIYLNAPLADGESINYKTDNLPDIVLNKGTNTITTDTAVKPKKISAKYYKK